MRILCHVNYPLTWAEGGFSIQIHSLCSQLARQGHDVDWLHHEAREIPVGDILQYFGKPPGDVHWQLARSKGHRIVVFLFTAAGANRPRPQWHLRGWLRPLIRALVGRGLASELCFQCWKDADAFVFLNSAERDYACTVYGLRRERTHVIPNGVDEELFQPGASAQCEPRLLVPANIRTLKRQAEIARTAREQRIPVDFVGGVLAGEESYAKQFRAVLDEEYARWLGAIPDRRKMAELIRGRAGVFLASDSESQPLALLEALAAGKPVMGPDLNSLRSYFGPAISYCHPPATPAFARDLRMFYDLCISGAPRPTFKPHTWNEVAAAYTALYRSILK